MDARFRVHDAINMIDLVTTIADVRIAVAKWRKAGMTVGFAPTMGALHEGHMSLIKSSRAKADKTVASVFVNPTQFAPHEDFKKYPRQLEQDRALLHANGCDLLYAPQVSEMYPEGFATSIDPGALAKVLEGVIRPHHFAGVATVVTKLFQQVVPDYAFFGEKDYQQLLVVRRIVRDLNVPIEVVPVPIARAEDGVALSSRNVYLTAAERQKAPVLYKTLRLIADAHGAEGEAILEKGRRAIFEAGFTLDYLELCDAQTLEPVSSVEREARALVAAKVGNTRLIDNMAILPSGK